jgi:DNA repair exonuclease SbcCD ATPase subunit
LYKEKARTCKSNKIALETSEVCPTCGRKYENVDNSSKIKELEEEYNEIVKIGIEKTNRKEQVEKLIKEINERKDLYEEKAKLVTENSSLEFNIINLKNAYKEQNDLLIKYRENHEAIDINNKLDIDINNISFKIKDRKNTKETNIKYIEQKNGLIENNNVNINERKNIINKIEEEIILERHWSIYLDMIGKNGISKMVLRNALPYINVEINSMLSEVCDFTVEIEITDKQEVIFYLIKDGVKSDLSSGSGFEKTASALALRTVLGETSSLSKLNGLILDEVWGRVAKENYDKMKLLCDKMLKYYDYIIQISHLDEIKDWHDHIITVTKVNNVSKINVVK